MARSVEQTRKDLSKRWVFTWNNYTDESEAKLKEFSSECEWLIYGREHAPETGTKHLQGFIHLKKRQRGSYLINRFEGVWFNKASGSNDDNEKYTKKEGDYVEYGTKPLTGGEANQKKWREAKRLALEGNLDDIPEDIYVRYVKNLEYISKKRKLTEDHSNWTDADLKQHRLWLWGETGTGKSHNARRIAKELGCDMPYMKGLNKWWDNYNGEKVVIIEEADPKRCEMLGHYFKLWLDKYDFRPETKGGHIGQMSPEYIIVTSNFCIDACFTEPQDSVPIHRRITEHQLSSKTEPFDWPLNKI